MGGLKRKKSFKYFIKCQLFNVYTSVFLRLCIVHKKMSLQYRAVWEKQAGGLLLYFQFFPPFSDFTKNYNFREGISIKFRIRPEIVRDWKHQKINK